MKTTLKFPVFVFQEKNEMIYVFFNEQIFKSTSTRFLNQGGFVGDTIIDSNGVVYKIKRAFQIKYLGFFGFSLIKKGRQILVDFEFEDNTTSVNIQEFKQFIISKIKKERNYWKSSYNITNLVSIINSCTDFKEIATVLK